MAKKTAELNSRNLLIVVFLVLVLVVVAYLLTSGKLALYKSGASSVYTVPKAGIVGGSNNRAQIVGGSNLNIQVKATIKPIAKPTIAPSNVKKATAY
ncbi:MAG: hypothetical protein ABSE04_02295 [Candidatus Microgenomates bacterium]|jgi:hypothetical protein